MVQEQLAPTKYDPIDRQEALMLYRDIVLGRTFEDMCAQMYYRGKMFGFVHLYNGQEAVSTGFIKQLRPDDYVTSTYRDHVHALSKGVPPRAVMAELFGKSTGCSKGRGGSMHLFSAEHNLLGGFAFIGEGIPIALGAAFAAKYRGTDQVSVCFFGDGTTNNGQFFECLNMAALWKLPILFVVENNLWSIGMQHHRASSVTDIYRKADAFDIPGYLVDGMDTLECRQAAIKAIKRARAGEGPTLLECSTYRFRGHSLADPDELRDPKEKEFWRKQDPIPKLTNFIQDQGLATAAELKLIEQEIRAEVEDAVQFGEDSPEPPVDELYRFQFAEDE
jgi:pyruvate dehydrogenase E1 component alpha subunit